MALTFVGRETELARLRQAVDDAVAGRPQLVIVDGPAGIGKTRLVERVGEKIAPAVMVTLWGRCWEVGAPVFWPWVQLLRDYAERQPDDVLSDELGSAGPDVAHLLPELHERFPDMPQRLEFDTGEARFRFFNSIVSFLRKASASQPLLIALDDLHAADKASLELTRFAAQELRDGRVLILGTARSAGRPGNGREAVFDDVVRSSERVTLSGFGAAEIRKMLLAQEIEPADDLVQRIGEVSGGNALFINQIVRLLGTGALTRADIESGHIPIPDDVREAIRAQVDPLAGPVRDVLEVASVIGREFDVRLLGAVSGLDASATVDLLDEPLRAGILEETRTPGQYIFGHPLVRETLYDSVVPQDRRRYHQTIGEQLERSGSDTVGPDLASLAHHFAQVATVGQAEKAFDYSVRNGDYRMSMLAYDEARDSYERAFSLLGLVDERPGVRVDLLLRIGRASVLAGDARSRATLLEAARLARNEGSTDQFVEAVLAAGEHGVVFGQVDDELVRFVQDALACVPSDDPRRAELLARLAMQYRFSSIPQRERALLDEAAAIARVTGEKKTLDTVLAQRASGLLGPDEHDEFVELLAELDETRDEQRSPLLEANLHILHVLAAVDIGDRQSYDLHIDATARIAAKHRLPSVEWQASSLSAGRELMRGRLDEGERLSRIALERGTRSIRRTRR